MSTPVAHRQPAAAARAPWLLLALLACGLLALAGGWLHRPGFSLAAAIVLLLAWLPAVWRRHSFAAIGVWLALAVLLLAPAALGHPGLAWLALPVVFLAAAAWMFARSLRGEREPLVTRFVRVIEGEPRLGLPGVRGYTRGVTVFWACLLGAMALLSLLVALFAVPGGWLATLGVRAPFALPGALLAWYPDVGCWIVLLAAFVGEYAFRRWYMRHIPHLPAPRFVLQLVRRWPALMRGEDDTA